MAWDHGSGIKRGKLGSNRLTLDKDQNKYKEARMIKVLYEIAMDDQAHARDRISAAKRILDLAAVNDDAEGRVGNLIQGLERLLPKR